jgi:tetratricopeptide (TPR) repeat protein
MIGTWRKWIGGGTVAGLLLLGCVAAMAQSQGQSGQSGQQSGQSGQQSGQSNPPAQGQQGQQGDKANTLTLDAPAAPVNAEEEAAFKAFDTIPMTDAEKKTKAGEDFATKYPQSRYLPPVYSAMVKLYLEAGNVQKMQEVGEKDIALAPTDVQTLAILGQTIPRSGTLTPQLLDKAEKYSKSAIELTPTIPKPEGMSDDQFTKAKNQTLAMAHAGLGLVYVRRGKFEDAVTELSASTKIDPDPQIDPVNYYLLGLANDKTSHFDDAIAAFTKCASVPGQMQTPCKSGAEDAKKHATSQLSAPK